MDPYEVLGVGRDADSMEVKRAYRRRAAEAHPDVGGSSEEFALVKHARDILADPTRRERYHRTGDTTEAQPDNTMSAALQMVAAALDETLGKLAQANRNPHEVDSLLSMMKSALRTRAGKLRELNASARKAIAINEKLLGRFKTAKGENLIEALIRASLANFRNIIEAHDRQLKAIEDAVGILDQYSFKADAAPRGGQSALMQMLIDPFNQYVAFG